MAAVARGVTCGNETNTKKTLGASFVGAPNVAFTLIRYSGYILSVVTKGALHYL